MLLQGLSGKDQEKVAEVSRVRVELQEQIGHLHAERMAQGGLKEKISALEREIKGGKLLLRYRVTLHVFFLMYVFIPEKKIFFWRNYLIVEARGPMMQDIKQFVLNV